MKKLLKSFADKDIHDDLYWSRDLEFSVLCNDFFAWGVADGEPISDELLPEFEKAYADIEDAAKKADEDPFSSAAIWSTQLYCARRRGIRPQGAIYDSIPEYLWFLFDEVGPKREVNMGNPREHPNDRS